MRLALVAGARPNFMKVAPIVRALRERSHHDWFLVHTGQHYDAGMSAVFFQELGLPEPDVWLGAGSGSHADQTARVMVGFEAVCRDRRPDLTLVVGDVNSTMAAAVVAAKAGIALAHVEAGLRSRDRSMPEEINRLVTDVLSDYLFTTAEDASRNLIAEGVDPANIHLVGNVMVDSLMAHLPRARASNALERLGLVGHAGEPLPYALLTLHRPSNVDEPEVFDRIMRVVDELAVKMPVVFPVHPRAATQVAARVVTGDLRAMPPLGYLEFIALTAAATLVLTDSGGLQEETTALGVPCLTLRENTERPITITTGTNVLVGTDPDRITRAIAAVLDGRAGKGALPPLWDGQAAGRIVDVLLRAPWRPISSRNQQPLWGL